MHKDSCQYWSTIQYFISDEEVEVGDMGQFEETLMFAACHCQKCSFGFSRDKLAATARSRLKLFQNENVRCTYIPNTV